MKVVNSIPESGLLLIRHVTDNMYIGYASKSGNSPTLLAWNNCTWSFRHLKYPCNNFKEAYSRDTFYESIKAALTANRVVEAFNSFHEYLIWAEQIEGNNHGKSS